jgi:hypothetical protein
VIHNFTQRLMAMTDLLIIALTAAFLALCAAYTRGLDRMGR